VRRILAATLPEPSGRATTGSRPKPPKRPTLERLVSQLADDSAVAHRIGLGFLLVFTIELALVIAATGCPAINAMPWDVATLLDGGFRVLHHQKPHVDFYSPLGFLPLALIAAGMKIGSVSASAFAAIQAFLLPGLTIWAWLLLRSRTSAFFAVFLSLWIGVLAITPRSLGYPAPTISYAMQYNRWGWALLLIACAGLFLPPRKGTAKIEPISSGIIAGLLLFLKINYFAAIALAIAIRMIAAGFDRRWFTRMALGFATAAAGGLGYLRFDFRAYLADLQLVASVQPVAVRTLSLVQLVFDNSFDLWLLASVCMIAMIQTRSQGEDPGPRFRTAAVPAALAALGIFTCSANWQQLQIPLIAFGVFLVVEQLRRRFLADGQALHFMAAALILMGMAGSALFLDGSTVALAYASKRRPAPNYWPVFDAAPLRDMRIPLPFYMTPESIGKALQAGTLMWRGNAGDAYPYVVWVNDGLSLLRPHISPDSHVVVLEFSNPFSFALGLTPPKGDTFVWHYGRDYDESHFLAPQRVFRDATHVMIPKAPRTLETETLSRIYAPILAAEFRRVGESGLWALYARAAPAQRQSSSWRAREMLASGSASAVRARQPMMPSGRTNTAPDGVMPRVRFVRCQWSEGSPLPAGRFERRVDESPCRDDARP
jgi:hypothetical protein